MPNWIKNRLTIGSRVEEVRDFLKGPNGDIDFSSISHMPLELDVNQSPLGAEGFFYLRAAALGDIEKCKMIRGKLGTLFDRAVQEGKIYRANIQNHGHPTGYEWRHANWGTNSNACSVAIVSSNCVEFQTAHNNATVSLERLSELFPDVVFEYAYADEDTGFNCGKGTIANGVSHMMMPSDESNKAYELSFELWPDEAKRFELIDGKYVYLED